MGTFSPQFQQLALYPQISAAVRESSTLTSMLNSFPGTIVIGSADSGSFYDSTTNTITIDPSVLPASSATSTIDTFATLLGHELGHATQPGGTYSWAGITNPTSAASVALNSEGVALYQEYLVAKDLSTASGTSVTMYSGSGVQSLIAAAGSESAAISAGANWASTQPPSTARNLTYQSYYADYFAVGAAGYNAANINWTAITSSDISITSTSNGGWGLAGANIPLLNSTSTLSIAASFTSTGGIVGSVIETTAPSGAITASISGVPTASVTLSGATVNVAANANVIIAGNNNTVYGSTGDTIIANGFGDTIYGAANSSLASTGNNIIIAAGGNDKIITASGGGNQITITNTSAGADTVQITQGNTITVQGNGAVVNMTASTNNTVNLDGANETLNVTVGSGDTGGAINIAAGATGEIVTDSNATITVGSGATFSIGANSVNDTINVSNLGQITNISSLPGGLNNDWFNEIYSDGTKQTVIINESQSLWKDSVGYLANGSEFDNTETFSNGTTVVEYWTPDSSSKWSTTTIDFNASGVATMQVTLNKDGTELITLFNQMVNGTESAVSYQYSSAALGNAAISNNNYQGFQGSVVFANGNTSSYLESGAINIVTSANWAVSGDNLGGDDTIQFFAGETIPVNVGQDAPSQFLGSNGTSQALAEADVGGLDSEAVDPLVLNLSGGAVATTAIDQNGVTFDMRGDGKAQQTGWITSGEAFLVDVSINSGAINSGSQLINSLNELAKFDTDGNGVVTAAEASSLRIWVPGGDGTAGGLYTLSQLGIASIDLTATTLGQADNGNEIDSTFKFVYANGAVGQGADVTFDVGGDSSTPASIPSSVNTGAQTSLNQLVQAAASFSSDDGAAITSTSLQPQVTQHSNLLVSTSAA